MRRDCSSARTRNVVANLSSLRGISILHSSSRLVCLFATTCLIAVGAAARPSLSQGVSDGETPFFVRLGYGVASYRTTGRAAVAGQAQEGARVALGDVSFAAAELGWRFAPDWSVSVLGGLPPTVALYGRGDFAGQGLLRKVTYGAVMAGVQYHPFTLGRFEPFLGAGLNYTAIFRTRAGALSELRVADNAGPYVQVGGQLHFTSSLSAFVDVRKTWLSFDSKGVAAGAPIRVSIDPDPVSATLGLSYRF
ncbi:OmpW family protein [Roseomonas sp. KE2513]|nr:OmpW family protein [Roseomonas sp. KE2513]